MLLIEISFVICVTVITFLAYALDRRNCCCFMVCLSQAKVYHAAKLASLATCLFGLDTEKSLWYQVIIQKIINGV